MKMTPDEKLEKWLTEVALEAIKKHPKSKLYAKVNHADNFALAVFSLAHDAVMDEISDFEDPHDVVWYNKMCATNEIKKQKYDAFIQRICLTAYEQLR